MNSISKFSDKEIMTDAIASQKLISGVYNTYANECTNTNLRDTFLNILNEEHRIQTDIFEEVQKRGWYQVKNADQNQISQAKTKFSNVSF